MFKPTFLYIKQHKVTGLKYFGMTSQDVFKYNGSGRYWRKHLKEHGYTIETVWFCLYVDQESLMEAANTLSRVFNVLSSEWANLKNESGDDGHGTGYRHTEETKAAHSARMKGRMQSPETIAKRVAKNKGKKRSPETIAKMKAALAKPERIEQLRKEVIRLHTPEVVSKEQRLKPGKLENDRPR